MSAVVSGSIGLVDGRATRRRFRGLCVCRLPTPASAHEASESPIRPVLIVLLSSFGRGVRCSERSRQSRRYFPASPN